MWIYRFEVGRQTLIGIFPLNQFKIRIIGKYKKNNVELLHEQKVLILFFTQQKKEFYFIFFAKI